MNEESRKEILESLYKLNYWFANEMLKEEQSATKFEAACQKATEEGADVILVSASTGNAKCMKGCMEAVVQVINFLRNKEEVSYIEPWQTVGVEAMLKQIKEDQVIPFDLPYAIQSVLGMWDELTANVK
ncbi:MAG: hypothetical protein PHR92_16495 [Lachnospiraceae bacterium]|nr:hypothetical protein [Lachnospiraceae bacterium]